MFRMTVSYVVRLIYVRCTGFVNAGPIIYQNRRNDKNIVIPPVLYIGFLSGK